MFHWLTTSSKFIFNSKNRSLFNNSTLLNTIINPSSSINVNQSLFRYIPQQLFSKYLPRSRAKRQPLNTKRAGKGYKKGYGARKEGVKTSKGNSKLIL